jgi:outer membrane receptor protein involved in Fe transport
VKGLLGVRWQPTWRMAVEGYGLGASKQTRLSPGDLVDQRIRAGGTPGFAIFGLRVSLPAGPLGNIYCSFENLGNKLYRWHGSGIDGPGRNAIIGIEHVFE